MQRLTGYPCIHLAADSLCLLSTGGFARLCSLGLSPPVNHRAVRVPPEQGQLKCMWKKYKAVSNGYDELEAALTWV